MGDDLKSSLESYRLQYTQVEAALTADASNDELLKLKADLEEVIKLTEDLLQQTQNTGGFFEDGYVDWKVGDKCLAPWSKDGKYYEAVIEEIADGKVSIGFTAYAHGDVCDISLIRPLGSRIDDLSLSGRKGHSAAGVAGSSSGGGGGSSSSGSGRPSRVAPTQTLAERRAALLKQKEYLKKRKQKKQARVQEQEKEREKDKKKWLNFSAKKGLMKGKKSIFASPETVDGRVGIGTCGVAGKGMTEFSAADKWKRGWKK